MANAIAQGFNLVMQLREPARLSELMAALASKREKIDAALNALDYVRSSRFLPLSKHGLLLIITEFDGVAKDYVMDFAAVLDAEFSLILSYMKDAPPLPVSRYPNEFWAYVDRNTRLPPGVGRVFTPYPDKSVLDIKGQLRAKQSLPPREVAGPYIPLNDLQANIVRGYGGDAVVHFGVRFESVKYGRSFVNLLLADSGLKVTPAEPWPTGEPPNNKPPYCLNIGFTYDGLAALGVPDDILRRFPEAFIAGPFKRAEGMGEIGNNHPDNWQTGEFDGATGKPIVVHALLSLYAAEKGGMVALEKRLCALMEEHHVESAAFKPVRAQVLSSKDFVHFGYRDNISEPVIAGVPRKDDFATLTQSPPGDFILGADYDNSRGGRLIGSLPKGMAENATYGAWRVIEQHVEEFETLLGSVAKKHDIHREVVAAKLMGRWRNGSSLSLCPDKPDPDSHQRSRAELDRFDYVTDKNAQGFDDFKGLRCPIGAHIRRLNPRGGLVLGIPWGRQIIRRGMPYGDDFNPECPSGQKRGLVGMFYCGDLETQYEFQLRVWANQDVSAPGLRDTQEPFIGAREGDTSFTFKPHEGEAVTIAVPRLTTCRGSLYLFVPGIAGLGWLAQQGWARQTEPPRRPQTGEPPVPPQGAGAPKPSQAAKAPVRPPLDVTSFYPSDPSFHTDPYPFYAALRDQEKPPGKLTKIGGAHNSYWIFSHKLVTEVCNNDGVFQKPGKDRNKDVKGAVGVTSKLGDGIFYMDKPRHGEVRAIMNTAFDQSLDEDKVTREARTIADELLAAMAGRSSCEFVGEYAAQLPMRIFMDLMGIPRDHAAGVDEWVRGALGGHDVHGAPTERVAGATATMALRSYFLALGLKCKKGEPPLGETGLVGAMQKNVATDESAKTMTVYEAMNTAVQFALGGYLSTQFLIASGVYTLLRHPDQWDQLLANRALLESAVQEMVRYEAPFQIADRWVAKGQSLNGFTFGADSKLAVVYGSANRDTDVYENADDFLIDRKASTPAYGFGQGIHNCIGAPLARIVARVALDALLDHYPRARLGTLGPWSNDPYYRSISHMTLLLR